MMCYCCFGVSPEILKNMLSFSCTLTSRILYIFDSYFGDTIFINFKILTNNIPLLRCHYFSNILSYMLFLIL